MAGARRAAEGGGDRVRDRTAHALSGRAGRAVDDVLSRPRGQRARIQGLRRSGAALRQIATSCLAAFRSEEHTSELQSLMRISYAVFCLKINNTLYWFT